MTTTTKKHLKRSVSIKFKVLDAFPSNPMTYSLWKSMAFDEGYYILRPTREMFYVAYPQVQYIGTYQGEL
jgi:hypothetical protein